MYIPFNSLPDYARLWIYQANRHLAPSEQAQLEQGLRQLCEEWSAHGAPLQTSFNILWDRFIVLGVDEQSMGASGCSIDGSVRLLKGLQQALGLDFFDRTRIAFLVNGVVADFPLSDLKSLFESQALSPDSISFDNTVTSKAAWKAGWQVPVKSTWMSRYLPKTAVDD